MGLLNFFKNDKNPYFIKNTDTVFDRILVKDLIQFFQEALTHYTVNQDKTKSFLGDRYNIEINLLIDLLKPRDYLEYLSNKRDKICRLSIIQDEKILNDEEVYWTALLKCDEFLQIIQFELLEQAIIQNNAISENNSALVLKSCQQIEIIKKSWTHLNNYQKAFPNNYQTSYVLFQIFQA